MKSISIGRVELDGRHVSGLRYNLHDARVAARLQAAGIAARLYTGKAEGRVLDLVRQLVRVRADAFLFTVSRLSLAPTLQLVTGLQQLRPDQRVLFAIDTPVDAGDANLREALAAHGDVLPAVGLDAIVDALAPRFEAAPAGAPRHASPYVSGLLSFDDSRRLGLALDQDLASLRDELVWLGGQPGLAETVLRLDAGATSPDELAGACAILAAAPLPCRFELHTTARAFAPALLDALLAARVDRIVLAGAAGPVDLHGRAIALAVAGDAETAALAARYGTNGVIALHTGCYFDANQAPAIYHVEVPLDLPHDARRRAYDWSAANMSLRSAAVVTGPLDLMLDHLPALRPGPASETGGWPKHTYALAASAGAGEVIFDGERAPAQALQYVPLHRLAATERAPHARTFVTLHADEDVAALERRLADFHASGRLHVPHPDFPLFFENMCRWLGNGACRLPLLRRIAVDGDGNVRACRDAGTLGVVGDSYDQLLLVAKQKQQMEDVRRGCATCPVRDDCSRCSQLPGEWGGRYCDIRQAHRMTPFYFELFAFPHLAAQLLPAAQADVELAVSWTGLPAQHYHGPAGQAPAGTRPVIVTIGDQHLVWWRATRRLTRLSAPMALMAEAWWTGAANDDIERALAARFDADAATARDSLAAGLDKLRAGGVIHG